MCRAFYRSCVSRRRLLEWQTADSAERNHREHLKSTQNQMIVIAVVSAVMMPILYHWHRLAPTGGFLALWMLSPVLLVWLESPRPQNLRSEQLTDGETDYLISGGPPDTGALFRRPCESGEQLASAR